MRVADYIATFLCENGIKDCFMVTGGGAMHLNDALGHKAELHCVFNHHESACAIAAEAYTRLSGRLAAVCVTSGPGGTNAITGVLGGFTDSIPMLILSGQVKRETTAKSCPTLPLRQLGDQECDIVNMVHPITKHAAMIWEPTDIAYELEKALYLATTGRGGPVWLDIPLDVQGAQIDPYSLHHFTPQHENLSHVPPVLPQTAQNILNRIKKAKAPLVLAGTGIRLGNAEEELLALLEKLQIPVVTAWNANDTVAYTHPLFAGMPGTVGTRSGNFAVQNCDLLLSLGCRLNIRMIGYNRYDFAKNAYKIIVDIDENELKKPTVVADMPVHADVKDLLGMLLREPYQAPAAHADWVAWCRELVMRYPAALPAYRNCENGALNPYTCMDFLFSRFRASDRIVCANGSACVITFQAAKIKEGQRMFTNSGCAAMGYGLPAAIGVAIADNSRRTICIEGDGSIMMNLQELATVAHNKLNVKIILLNNNGYHSIRQTQRNLFGEPFVGLDADSGIGFPDFGLLAKAFGIEYYLAASEAELAAVAERALNAEGACLFEIAIDPTQDFAPKSAAKILPDGRMISPSLDDMAPFLDRAEYDAIRYQKQEVL
ncbi:MAG: thiamine pyrophosphate-binding protein [Clostridia bacterium]|nr:thiamine pyrophosphate-binding protein [Clostridia bacterium]